MNKLEATHSITDYEPQSGDITLRVVLLPRGRVLAFTAIYIDGMYYSFVVLDKKGLLYFHLTCKAVGTDKNGYEYYRPN
jgi:hypothetical protein